MLTFDDIVTMAANQTRPLLVAIDGRPLAGKSTLAQRLVREHQACVLYLDDFVLPEAQWPPRDQPGFPFPYIRYDEFLAAVRDLALHGACQVRRFDWETGQVAAQATTLRHSGLTIVEGVSALHPDLAPLYDLRLWVESDAASTLKAAIARGVGPWAHEWEHYFLPSVERYLRTDPPSRADHIVQGRNASQRWQTGQ